MRANGFVGTATAGTEGLATDAAGCSKCIGFPNSGAMAGTGGRWADDLLSSARVLKKGLVSPLAYPKDGEDGCDEEDMAGEVAAILRFDSGGFPN